MNRPIRFVVVLLILGAVFGGSYLGAAPAISDLEVHFSPGGGCTEAIVREIGRAQRQVLVQAYSFTSMQISQAISKAYGRGVKVVVILDESNLTDKHAAVNNLLTQRVPTFVDSKHNIAHNKVIVIDEQTVITGSFNFTVAAEKDNAENLLIVRRSELASKYVQNFMEHFKHSEIYKAQ